MAREYVDSSSIRWFDFDPVGGTLEVEYDSGGVYRYAGVSSSVCNQLRAAPSKGRFVNEVIKPQCLCTVIRRP